MHHWGDKDSQGRDICYRVEDAADYIGSFLAKWGRINVLQAKEKFGTVRIYSSWGWSCFHGIIWPSHCWIHKWWPYSLDLWLSGWLLPIFVWLTEWYRRYIYRLAYKKALKKWPDIRHEILSSVDYEEIMEGYLGYKHSDYWREV